MKTTLAAMMAALVGGLIGCSSSEERNEQGMYDDDAPQSRGGPHDDWTRLQDDPVCGRTVNPKSAISREYGDQMYYFDSEECAEKFKDNPHAYLPGGDDRGSLARMETDPVCGTVVDSKTAIRETYQNSPYYFHSWECARRFRDNPQAYIPGGAKEVR